MRGLLDDVLRDADTNYQRVRDTLTKGQREGFEMCMEMLANPSRIEIGDTVRDVHGDECEVIGLYSDLVWVCSKERGADSWNIHDVELIRKAEA